MRGSKGGKTISRPVIHLELLEQDMSLVMGKEASLDGLGKD